MSNFYFFSTWTELEEPADEGTVSMSAELHEKFKDEFESVFDGDYTEYFDSGWKNVSYGSLRYNYVRQLCLF